MMYRMWLWILRCIGFDPRGIFRFYDGTRFRNCDPIVLIRRLWAVEIEHRDHPDIPGAILPFDSEKSHKLIATGIGDNIQRGFLEISQAVREAFEVSEVEYGGLTEAECDQLLSRFQNYIGDLKKNGSPKPISSPSMDSTEKLDTNNDSPSGSSSTVSTYELPDVSDLELLTPGNRT